MQWILMLLGAVLGVLAGQSPVWALLGGVLGLSLGQALQLQGLVRQNRALRAEQADFAARFARGTSALHERLLALEAQATTAPPAAPEAAPEPVSEPQAEAVAQPSAAPVEAAFEAHFDWAEIQPEASAAVAPPAPVPPVVEPRPAPQAASAWQAPPAPAEPAAPGPLQRAWGVARDWLLGGNMVLRVGVLLLFLGLAFLLRYATEGVVVPVELRYAGVAAAALALLGLGWWLRLRRSGYALVLQGGGIAVLYLTVFAAMRLHPLLSAGEALLLLVVITACSAILAVTQNALGLAAAAALGGFAAPILTSTGSGNHVALFSYFILLNSGILAIAWFKAWRLLNLIGFLGTFGIGLAWGMRSYTAELFWSTEPFLLLFFLMYVAIGLLFARRRLLDAALTPPATGGRGELLRWSARQGDYLDASVLFGPPLIGFGLQFAVVRHLEFAPAFSALGLGLFYILLARLLAGRARVALLMETCLALGVIFGSLAIPLGLDARWTSAAWAVEGAGIYWLGLRQQRPLARVFALLLQLGALLAFLGELAPGRDGSLLGGVPLGALMLGLALLFVFLQLRRAQVPLLRYERQALPWLASLGLAALYLVAPLCLGHAGTAVSWALAGLATLWFGLRLQARSFLFCAFAVQLLGGVIFLLQLQAGSDTAVLHSGWRGLLVASLVGLALVAGMLLAARDRALQADPRLMLGLSLVLLAGLVFLNLAVLFVLPWQSASAVWAGSGLLIVWLSLFLQQRAGFYFGLLLQLVGGLAFLAASPLLFHGLSAEGLRPLAHGDFWTPAALALAALFGAWRLWRVEREQRAGALDDLSLARLSQVLLAWGAAWWVLAGSSEVLRFAPEALQAPLLLLVAAASVLLWCLLARRTGWVELSLLCALLVPAGALVLLHAWQPRYHPLAGLGGLGWGALLLVHFFSLRRLATLLPARLLSALHVGGCWLLLSVLALELRYLLLLLAEQYNAWRWLGWALLPALYLLAMAAPRRWPWPVAAFAREYRVLAAAPLAALMLAWFWLANLFSDGAADPLPYLPLFNPLELGLLVVLLALYGWWRSSLPQQVLAPRLPTWLPALVAGLSLFALLTAAVMRTVHQWWQVPYQLDALLASMAVQAGLSLVWTLVALTLMIGGHLRVRRELWLAGALLIGVVVAKLFFIELGNRGGLERIVSFIGVGVLLLVVGYFAPLPPQRASQAENS